MIYNVYHLLQSVQQRSFKLKKELRVISSALYDDYLTRLTIKETQELVENIVEKSSTTIEEAHKAALNATFELLEKVSEDKETTQALQKLHNTIASGIYETLRITNKQFGNLTNELLNLKEKEKKDEI
ncbi:MAG: hypothetical protein KDK90_12505 [Leptospiraceae bacterium]|nr:hypothetical protein [Leptospiraceae bacterium]